MGPESFGIPEIDIGDPSASDRFSNLGLQNGAGGRVATSYQIANDVSWTRGSHAFKFGFNFLHNYSDYTVVGSRGLFTFDGSQLGNTLTSDGGLAGLIDLIAGLPAGQRLDEYHAHQQRSRQHQSKRDQRIRDGQLQTHATTHVNRRAALRFFHYCQEDRGRFSVFDPTQGFGSVRRHIYNAPKGNFGPRVAFAWTPPITVIPGRQTIVRAGFGVYYDTIPLNNFEEGLTTNPIGTTGGVTITPNPPIPFGVGVPIFGTGAPEPPFNIASINHNLKTPNTQTWNLNIQQELSQRVVFQIGYVGNHSTHQLQLLDINQPTPGDVAGEQCRRPFNTQFPDLRQINTISSAGWAHYNALQAVLRSTNFHGLTTQVSFTWSHNLDTASEVENFFGTSGYVPQDSTKSGWQLRKLRVRSAPGVDFHLRVCDSVSKNREQARLCVERLAGFRHHHDARWIGGAAPHFR